MKEIKAISDKHPLNYPKLADCKTYYDATAALELGFFAQFEKGYIEENNLIMEIQPHGVRVPSHVEPPTGSDTSEEK